MVGLAQAAKMIGYSEPGLRDLVKRRKIRFFQPHPHCPVKFRPEWLAEFRKRAAWESEQRQEPQQTGQVRWPRTLAEALQVFTRELVLAGFLERKYRPDGEPFCHACGSPKVSVELTGACRCRACGHRFNVKDGTALEGSTASLRAWVIAAWCIYFGKDSIPAGKLAAALRISRTAAGQLLAVNRQLRDR